MFLQKKAEIDVGFYMIWINCDGSFVVLTGTVEVFEMILQQKVRLLKKKQSLLIKFKDQALKTVTLKTRHSLKCSK